MTLIVGLTAPPKPPGKFIRLNLKFKMVVALDPWKKILEQDADDLYNIMMY